MFNFVSGESWLNISTHRLLLEQPLGTKLAGNERITLASVVKSPNLARKLPIPFIVHFSFFSLSLS
jgi:hypothetical protein